MSPLPVSRSAPDKLGDRLVASDEISDDAHDLLLQVLTAYQAALGEAQDRIIAVGYSPTVRVKTSAVLIEKLRREQGMKLKGVQDVAGARVVVPGGRLYQDEAVTRIVTAFESGPRPPKVKDRRVEPSAGYRAVHVIPTVQDVPVEIQVRTRWQDEWAQIVESLGDKWGRGVRYGQGPLEPERRLFRGGDMTRGKSWELFLNLSGHINVAETAAHILAVLDLPEPARSSTVDVIVAWARKRVGRDPTSAEIARMVDTKDDLRAEVAESARLVQSALAAFAKIAATVQ